jgi:HAE1 family hydrophobic/amphiphilic exporter-1
MTSLAFILGCIPLAKASGAGALSRQVMGFAVIGGMVAASFIAIFLIPACFYVIERIGGKKHALAPPPAGAQPAPGSAH